MIRFQSVILGCGGLLAASFAAAQGAAPLKLIATTPMPGFHGDFDHFGVDEKGGRLFLAAEIARTVEVFDFSGARTGAIQGFGHPLNMQYLPADGHLLVTDGGFPDGAPGAIRVIDCSDYHTIGSVTLPPNVDHAAYDPHDGCYYVESGSGTSDTRSHLLNFVDVARLVRTGSLVLPGESNEGMVIDGAGKKLYINLTGPDTVGVVDLGERTLAAQWPIPDGAAVAHAIGLDEAHRRLFTVTRKPGRFIVLDLDSGAKVASLPCVGTNSDLTYDAPRKLIYVTGDGYVSVIRQVDADHYETVADVPSAYRAKSSIFVPKVDRLFVAASGKGQPDAKLKLMVFQAAR